MKFIMRFKKFIVLIPVFAAASLTAQQQSAQKNSIEDRFPNHLISEVNSSHIPIKVITPSAPYKTSVGLGIESGGGNSIVGPSYKHYFSSNTAYSAELLFGMGSLTTNVLYQHHQELKKGNKVKWYNGGGFSTTFAGNGTAAFIKLMSGLETELPDLPLFISVDWRPTIFLGRTMGGGRFVPSRFGIAVRYTLAD